MHFISKVGERKKFQHWNNEVGEKKTNFPDYDCFGGILFDYFILVIAYTRGRLHDIQALCFEKATIEFAQEFHR